MGLSLYITQQQRVSSKEEFYFNSKGIFLLFEAGLGCLRMPSYGKKLTNEDYLCLTHE